MERFYAWGKRALLMMGISALAFTESALADSAADVELAFASIGAEAVRRFGAFSLAASCVVTLAGRPWVGLSGAVFSGLGMALFPRLILPIPGEVVLWDVVALIGMGSAVLMALSKVRRNQLTAPREGPRP